MYREISSGEMISILAIATKLQKIRWTRVADYLFYNGRNKSLLNYTTLFTESKTPRTTRDVPHADLTKSYYCEYGGAAFCLMLCTQVLRKDIPAEDFYNFMVQCDPYGNFGYFGTPEKEFQGTLVPLIECVEDQLSLHYLSRFSLNKTLLHLQEETVRFNPETDTILSPSPLSPPYKHSCVVDENNNYITFVLVLLECDETGIEHEKIQHYTLGANERLLDVSPPGGLINAHWNGLAWEETATDEEIAEHR